MAVHKNEYGTVFTITVQEDSVDKDISAATETLMIFKAPDEVLTEKTAAFVTDGTNGEIDYTSETGLFDETGTWEVQAKITTASGVWYTVPTAFEVTEI